MAAIIIGDYFELKLYSYLDSQLGINVIHGRVLTLPGGGLEDFQAVGDFSTFYAATIKDLLATPAKYLGASLRIGRVGFWDLATVWSKAGAGFGTAGATPAPKQCSGLIAKTSAVGGPGGRGRTYVPFPATADVEANGNPTAAYLTRLDSYGDRMTTDETIDVGFQVTFGRLRWRQPDSFLIWQGYTSRDRFATQQRRGDYGRVNAIPTPLA